MSKVSVIIPVYKTEFFLKKCLNSVIHQTLEDIEIIIVNDNSPDNSQTIIDEYAAKDRRIRVVKSEVNQGLSMARNAGLKISTGEYVGFVDSDDWLELDMYEVMYNTAVQQFADFVICDCNSIYDTHIESSRFKIINEFINLHDLTLGKYIQEYFCPNKHGYEVWNKLYRLDIIQKNDVYFKDSLRFGEDALFNLFYLLYINKFCSVNKAMYNYLQRSDSLMSLVNPNLLNDITIFINSYYERLCINSKDDILKSLYPNVVYHFIELFFSIRIIRENTKFWKLKTEVSNLYNFPEINKYMRMVLSEAKTPGRVISTFLILKKQIFLLSLYKIAKMKY